MKMNFIKWAKIFSLPAMALGLLVFTGCGGDDEEAKPTMDIVELISSSKYQQASGAAEGESLDSLVKYLGVYPDLIELLGGSTEYTLFAPSNSAFKSLLATPGFPEDITDIDPAIVKGVLSYHVVSGTKLKADLTAGTSVTTAETEAIVVNADGTLKTGSTNQAIEIVSADLKATNGVVHLVATVLIPPSVGTSLTPILGTNAGTILLGAPFTTLAAGIKLGDAYAAANSKPTLTSILAGSTVHTVFAPTNATFTAGQITANTFTGEQWYGIIANHVVLGQTIAPADLTTGKSFNTAAGGKILVFNNTAAIPPKNGVGIYLDGNGSVDLNVQSTYTTFDAEVALPNAAENSNGVIHVIAGVLSPL
ncbi:fasciclin domain-containing protein [uncultured Imperialibacter sp.]|uniref:fasciclin domain-containing protein n=1 Tax=uncultured Imperialibacter sp. TaxID=1672639 RepID=UPI0030DA4887|tara:strand:+ start:4257 stop:5351 length:1095 start_codon:yes stop_codon:yes gene_type:complete